MEQVIGVVFVLVVVGLFIAAVGYNYVRWSDEERPNWERARAKRKARRELREQERREREQRDE